MCEFSEIEKSGQAAEALQPSAAPLETPQAPAEQEWLNKSKALLQRVEDAKDEYNRKHFSIFADKSFVRLGEKIPPLRYFLHDTATDVDFFPNGDLCVISGKMKNGKSHWAEELVCSLLGYSNFGYEPLSPDCRIGYIDTEQNRGDVQALLRRVATRCEFDLSLPDEEQPLVVFSMRGSDNEETKAKIVRLLKEGRLQVLFVDGVADLANDYNSSEDSHKLVYEALLNWCADFGVTVVGVMHENKDNNNLKGHLGTMLGQKLFELYSAKREGVAFPYTFTIEMTESRSGHVINKVNAEFDPAGNFVPSDKKFEREETTKETEDDKMEEFAGEVRVLYAERGVMEMSSRGIQDGLHKSGGSIASKIAKLGAYGFERVGSGNQTRWKVIN